MRLTKQLREAIYTDLHDLKFKAPEADLQKRIKEFLISVYWAQLSKEEYQLLHTLPKKFLCTSVRTIRSTGIYLFYEQYVDQQTCKDKAD